ATGSITIQPPGIIGIDPGDTATVSTTFVDPLNITSHTVSVTFNWGDGQTWTTAVVEANGTGTLVGSHEYDNTGPYFGSIYIDGGGGDVGSELFEVVVPTFYNDVGDGFTIGQAFTLTPTFSDPDGNTVGTYTVAWGDGTATETYGGNSGIFTHSYSSDFEAPYTATVVASAADGTYTRMPNIPLAGPTLSLSGLGSATEGSDYALTDSVASGDPGATYAWTIDWGDDSAEDTPSAPVGSFDHTYTEPGTYTIDAIVDDADSGAGDVGFDTVTIAAASPTESFSLVNPSLFEGEGASFTDSFSQPAGHTLDNLSVAWGD